MAADTTDEDYFTGSKGPYDSVARPMNAAINSAIQQVPASFSDVQAICPTGNCTFPDYETMGVCSEAEDVSSTIVRNCHRRFPGDTTPNCFYSVKDLQDDPPYREDNMTIFEIPMSLWVGAGDTGMGDNTENTNPVSLGTFYTIYFHNKGDINSMDSKSSDYTPVLTAVKGSLNLCTMTLQTKVTNGVTSTTQTQQTSDLPWAKSQMTINGTDTPVISATAADGNAVATTRPAGSSASADRSVSASSTMARMRSAWTASRRPVSALVLVTPYNSIQELAAQRYPYVPIRWLLIVKFESWR